MSILEMKGRTRSSEEAGSSASGKTGEWRRRARRHAGSTEMRPLRRRRGEKGKERRMREGIKATGGTAG
jgi:hypothetical protein